MLNIFVFNNNNIIYAYIGRQWFMQILSYGNSIFDHPTIHQTWYNTCWLLDIPFLRPIVS